MRNRYKLIIFDWDGTLSNSEEKIVNCLRAASRDCQQALLSDKAYADIIGLGLPEVFATLYPDLQCEQTHLALREAYSKHFLEKDNTPIEPFADVFAGLEMLREHGYSTAIATGKSRRGLNKMLDSLAWHHYFDATRCASETSSKPDPLMLHELLAELGVDVAEALMVGDTSYDLEMANNAGMDAVAVNYGVHDSARLAALGPVAQVDSFKQLLDALV